MGELEALLSKHEEPRQVLEELHECKSANGKLYCKIDGEWTGFTMTMLKSQLYMEPKAFKSMIRSAKANTNLNRQIGAFPEELR